MAGTTWPTLTAGQMARAADVESKFEWLMGSLAPMNLGSQTDAVYDLGSVSANWRCLYAYSINATSTSKGLAIGTTTVSNHSDVALEIAGKRAMLFKGMTTAQRTAITGINGMLTFDSDLGLFKKYEGGLWGNMGGEATGFVFPIYLSATSSATATVAAISAAGKLIRLRGEVGSSSNIAYTLNIDGATYGEFSLLTTGSNFLNLNDTETADTTTVFKMDTSGSGQPVNIELGFKNTLNVYHRRTAGANAKSALFYERV